MAPLSVSLGIRQPTLDDNLRAFLAAAQPWGLILFREACVTREAGPMKHGTTVIAFVRDPDGYLIELIQRGP